MADVKISNLPASTTPLAGTEVLPIVQSGTTKQVSVANLTAGRDVGANSFSSAAGTVSTPAITTTGDTNTGFWFPAADTIAASTAGTERMRIDSAGRIGIAGTTVAGVPINIGYNLTGTTSVVNVRAIPTILSDVTSQVDIFKTQPFVQNAAFTLAGLTHYYAAQGSFGALSTVANQYGFFADAGLTGATNNYGFLGNIASGTGRFNFYASGTAANVFVGTTSIGGVVGAESLRVTPVASAVNYLEVKGAAAGGSVSFSSVGSNADISINYWSKGNSGQLFGTGSAFTSQFAVTHTASAVNNIYVTGGVSGATPRLYSSTANIPVAITGSHTWAGFANASAAIGVVADVTAATGGHVVIGSITGNAPYIGSSNHSTSGNNGLRIMTAGTTQLHVTHTASAVNYMQITGAVTGGNPYIFANGSDSTTSMDLIVKGAGAYTFFADSGTSRQFQVARTASAVNYLQATGAATGAATTLSAQGTDTNIDLALTPKGTGVLKFGTYTAGILAQAGYITIKDAAGNTRNLLVG